MRKAHDYYVTPVSQIKIFLNKLIDIHPYFFHNARILDPCAGGDVSQNMSYPQALKEILVSTNITTMDIREDSLAEIKQDFLTYQRKGEFDIIIGNPPYTMAAQFLEKSMELLEDGGSVIFLLRSGFLASEKRQELFAKVGYPDYEFMHSKRISFTGEGSPSDNHCHFIWTKGSDQGVTLKYVLDYK